ALPRGGERVAREGASASETRGGAASGHPLHPPLTDVVVGAWTSAVALDWLGGDSAGPAADWLVALGVASALPTAAAGLNDFATPDGPTPPPRPGPRTTQGVTARSFAATRPAPRQGP